MVPARKGRAGQPQRLASSPRRGGTRVEGRDSEVNRIIKRMAVPVGAAIILGSSGFAFMASNTVAQSFVGEGQGDIAGYAVSGTSYHTSNGDLTWASFYADPRGPKDSSSDPAEAQITFDGQNWI